MAYSKEELQKREKGRELADNISAYLNDMEKILSEPMTEQEKSEAFNQVALLVGKTMVSFCSMCENYDVYAGRRTK